MTEQCQLKKAWSAAKASLSPSYTHSWNDVDQGFIYASEEVECKILEEKERREAATKHWELTAAAYMKAIERVAHPYIVEFPDDWSMVPWV